MKKYLLMLCICAVAATAFMGCPTTTTLVQQGQNWILLDHENAQFNLPAPGWLTADIRQLEQSSEYQGDYVFRFETDNAADLRGAQALRDDWEAARGISRLVAMRVQNRATAAVVGDDSATQAYIEDTVNIITNTTITGFQRVATYWTLRRFFNQFHIATGDFYNAYALYAIPKDMLDQLVQNAFQQALQDQPTTDSNQLAARTQVQQAIAGGM